MSASRQSRLPPGTLLDDKYQIGKVLGQGGMGTVYEAVHVGINRKVAVKILSSDRLGDSNVIARFLREARTAGELGSDNICEVTDLGSTPTGTPYFVMPLLRGSDLGQLAQKEPLNFIRSTDMVIQVLTALAVCHAAGIVHRDIKPANIFITKVGDRNDFVKILDFGISKILRDDGAAAVTRTGEVLGTPYYMSPEQAAGQSVDHRTDLYSLGVILYELLSGRRPFSGSSYNEIMFRIVNTEPLPLVQISPAVPPHLAAIVTKAMKRAPQDRFSSAAEFRATLAAVEIDPQGKPLLDLSLVHGATQETLSDVLPREAAPRTPAAIEPPSHPATGATRRSAASRLLVPVMAVIGAAVLGLSWLFLGPAAASQPTYAPAKTDALTLPFTKAVTQLRGLPESTIAHMTESLRALRLLPAAPTAAVTKNAPVSPKPKTHSLINGHNAAPAQKLPPPNASPQRIPGRAGTEISVTYE